MINWLWTSLHRESLPCLLSLCIYFHKPLGVLNMYQTTGIRLRLKIEEDFVLHPKRRGPTAGCTPTSGSPAFEFPRLQLRAMLSEDLSRIASSTPGCPRATYAPGGARS